MLKKINGIVRMLHSFCINYSPAELQRSIGQKVITGKSSCFSALWSLRLEARLVVAADRNDWSK